MASFFTTGDAFTRLLRDFVSSGEFEKVIEILRDGGIPDNLILDFIDGKYRFKGDTRKNPDLSFVEDDNEDINLLLTGWRTLCNRAGRDIDDFTEVSPDSKWQDFNSLFQVISEEEFCKRYQYKIIESLGYTIYKEPCLHKVEDGVITEHDYFIETGYQGHAFLYPHLLRLGLATSSHWTDDTKCFHISSRAYSGKVGWSISSNLYREEVTITDTMLDAVFAWRHHFNGFYSEGRGGLVKALIKRECKKFNNGSKYGHLMFLKRYYDFNTPRISKDPLEGKFCVRSSPKKSIPGVLNSYFDVTKDTYEQTLKKTELDWKWAQDNVPKLTEYNVMNTFCQEYVEGYNGVCHYKGPGTFTYDVGLQGQVVKGVNTASSSTSESLVDFEAIHHILRPIARALYEDIKEQIQLEFVVKDGKVTIVQLRTIDTPRFKNSTVRQDLKIIATGTSFTSGCLELEKKDCIIIDNEVESRDVVGKGVRAILVRDNVEFSHVLALSQSLNIPSIYGIGGVELPERFYMDTRYISGIIFESSIK